MISNLPTMIDDLDHIEFYKKLREDFSEVQVRWTAGGGKRFSGKAKVVKINPKSITVELMEDVKTQYGHIPKGHVVKSPVHGSHAWSVNNGVFPLNFKEVSPPEVKVQIGSTTIEYQVFQTTAPRALDYEYVLTLHFIDSEHRIIAIPKESSYIQLGRYRSIFSDTKPLDDYLLSECEKWLWQRVLEKSA